MKDIQIPGQMTIFDCLSMIDSKSYSWHTIIQDLYEDLKPLINGDGKPSYEIWDHVPKLGKRFEICSRNTILDMETFYKICDKYKEKQLDVSAIITPSLYNDNLNNYFISTMWLTKGHKEPKEVMA
jgi:hypothetical protein